MEILEVFILSMYFLVKVLLHHNGDILKGFRGEDFSFFARQNFSALLRLFVSIVAASNYARNGGETVRLVPRKNLINLQTKS
jgi:hypothetical protein